MADGFEVVQAVVCDGVHGREMGRYFYNSRLILLDTGEALGYLFEE